MILLVAARNIESHRVQHSRQMYGVTLDSQLTTLLPVQSDRWSIHWRDQWVRRSLAVHRAGQSKGLSTHGRENFPSVPAASVSQDNKRDTIEDRSSTDLSLPATKSGPICSPR